MIKFTIPIEPKPLRRVRFAGHLAYEPPSNRKFKETVSIYAKGAMDGREPFNEAISVTVDLYRNRPKEPTSKNWGDVDNHLKAVLDALNGICYIDDSLIVDLRGRKFVGTPRIEVTIEEVD